MNQSGEHPRQNPESDLDDLLGLDPDPRLSSAARERIDAALQGAQHDLGVEERLDRLLAQDEVQVPHGLAERILAGVSAERDVVLQPAARGPRPLLSRPFAALTLAAAAALVVLVGVRATKNGGGTAEAPGRGAAMGDVSDGTASGSLVAQVDAGPIGDDGDYAPSDELLAALPLLLDLDFLTEDLDPFEADALLLFDVDELLLMDLVDLEGRGDDDESGDSKAEVKKG